MFIVYKHTNTVTGKAYIGYTGLTMEERWKQHVDLALQPSKKNRQIKFWNALRKYGTANWSHEVLSFVMMEKDAKLNEIYFIAEYNSFRKGYNSTLGGDGFRGKHTNKTKQLISDATHRCASRMRANGIKRKRKPHTKVTIKNISNGHKKPFILKHEDGRVVTGQNLSKWCQSNGVSKKTLLFARWKNRSVGRGPLKGWNMEYVN